MIYLTLTLVLNCLVHILKQLNFYSHRRILTQELELKLWASSIFGFNIQLIFHLKVVHIAAWIVFLRRHATVQGPTPPGPGVTKPATSATAGSTSPKIFDSPEPTLTREMPTSTTNEPDLTNSGLQRWLIPWLINLMSILVIKRQRTNRITAKLHDKQCDHMAKLSLQYWAHYNNANLPNILKICPTQLAPNFAQYKINPQIIAKDF